MPARPIVHIVDDDDAIRDALGLLLRLHGFRVRDYPSAQSFLDADGQHEGGCILTDVQMARMSGLEMLARLRSEGVALPAVVMTGRAERRMAEEALRQGAQFLDKPFAPDEIVAAIRRAIDAAA